MRVQVDGQSVSRFRERAVAQWFRQLDRNRDGFLDKTEIAGFLKALAEQPGTGPRPTRPSARMLIPLTERFRRASFVPLSIVNLGRRWALAVRTEGRSEVDASLFRHLDLNGDGVLTADELQYSAALPWLRLDADDDETISMAELMAASQEHGLAAQTNGLTAKPSEQAGRDHAPADRLPLMILGPDTPWPNPSPWLCGEYGAEESRRLDGGGAAGPGVRELSQRIVKPCGPSSNCTFRSYSLTSSTVGREFRSCQPVIHRISSGSPDRPIRECSRKRRLGGRHVGQTNPRCHRRYEQLPCRLRFNIVDRDKNKYLDRREFARSWVLPGADFAAVDANGDGQIVAARVDRLFEETSERLRQSGRHRGVGRKPIAFRFSRHAPRRTFEAPCETECGRRLGCENSIATTMAISALGELRTQIRLEVEVKRPAETRSSMRVVAPRNPMSTAGSTRPRVRNGSKEWTVTSTEMSPGVSSWAREQRLTNSTPITTAC